MAFVDGHAFLFGRSPLDRARHLERFPGPIAASRFFDRSGPVNCTCEARPDAGKASPGVR
jgi:hypothetical protein